MDSLGCVADAENGIVHRFGRDIDITCELLQEQWSGGWQGLYQRVCNFSPEEIRRAEILRQDLFKDVFGSIKLCSGMDSVVKKLARQHNLLVVSSNYSEVIYQTLVDTGLIESFSSIYGQDSLTGVVRSDPRFFLIPLEELNLEKEQTIIIGDTIDEVAAGRKAGIPVIACSWGWQLREQLVNARPDYLADSPDELSAIVRSM